MAEAELRELFGRDRMLRRVPAILALVGIGILYLLLSSHLTLVPGWVPIVVVLAFAAVAVLEAWRPRPATFRGAALALSGFVTALLVSSTALLVSLLLAGDSTISAAALLQGATIIWIANVLTFAVWYYEIDGGGPLARRRAGDVPGDFLFPQQTFSADQPGAAHWLDWEPRFIDYLFLAFNTSAAFSPTDTLTLSRLAKVLMMIQSLVSLATVAVLLARAVNSLR
jgi:hypothetical protein